MPAGRPRKYDNPEQMQEVVDKYFRACNLRRQLMAGLSLGEDELEEIKITEDEHPTITGLSLALDLDRDSLLNYGERDEFFGTVKEAKFRVLAYNEQRLHGNNVTGVIFSLKNNFGWKDKQELSGDKEAPLTVNIGSRDAEVL